MAFFMNNLIWDDDDNIDELELIEFGVPRRIHNRANHFHDLDDYTFFKKFRLTKETVMILLPLIERQLEFPVDINQCVSPICQVLTALRYYATGSHLDSIADYMGMHSTTAIRIIPKVSRAIASLYSRFIKLPVTEDERSRARRNFYDLARFPHVIGAIDCTHLKVISPGGIDAEVFRNRKNYFSINVQGICDANMKFINIVARWPGSTHDSTIFNMSNIRTFFEDGRFPNSILLGDSGYPSRKYLLTPLVNPRTEAEQLYNQSHIRTRNKIECCFGILKRRFPVLAYGCRLKLQNSLSVIVAVTVLHNLARDMNEAAPDADEEHDIQDLSDLIANGNIPIVPPNDNALGIATSGMQFRTQLVNDYFAVLNT